MFILALYWVIVSSSMMNKKNFNLWVKTWTLRKFFLSYRSFFFAKRWIRETFKVKFTYNYLHQYHIHLIELWTYIIALWASQCFQANFMKVFVTSILFVSCREIHSFDHYTNIHSISDIIIICFHLIVSEYKYLSF